MSKNYKYYIFYLLLAILAYWQVSFFQNMLKWDMIDVHLPWRVFISESIINGHFPLWNPYQDFGYPIHADMRSIWTPEIWLMSLFGGYSVYTFSILFIVYTSIAGIGMKLLSNYFLKDEKASFFTGLIYMLSGYLTAHAQELYTINSFAFIPIILYQYLKFKDTLTYKRGMYFIFFTFLILVSGYQAHSFMLFYLLIFLFGFIIIEFYRKKQFEKIKRFILFHFGFGVVIVILLLPLIVSAFQVFPFVQRLNSGVGLETLSILSFSPQSMVSLILPFASVRDMEFFSTDLSMTNLYFGIISLILMIVSITKLKRKSIFFVIFIYGLICLIASFGDYTPFRKILFDYVPFMDMFRGSAFFRLFALIAFVISAGFVVSKIDLYKKSLLIVTSFFVTVFIAFTIYSYAQIDWTVFSFSNPELKWLDILEKKSTLYENVFIQSILQLCILSIFIFLLLKGKANYKNILGLVILDLFLAIQLNVYSTTVSKHDPNTVNDFISSQPKGFPIPSDLKISECSDKHSSFGPLWRNTNIFAKRISGDAFNSFYLDKTQTFRDSLLDLRNTVSKNKFLYFSNDVRSLSDIGESDYNHKTLYIADSLTHLLQNKFASVNGDITVKDFNPNRISIDVDVSGQTFITLIQTYYPGWRVLVDGEEVSIIESNTMFMSVLLSEGHHELVFEYTNSILVKSFYFSSALFIILLLLILGLVYKDSLYKHKRIAFISCLILFVFWSIYKQYNYHNQIVAFDDELKEIIEENEESLFILDKDIKIEYPSVVKVDFSQASSVNQIKGIINELSGKKLIISSKNKPIDKEALAFIESHFNKKEVLLDAGSSKVLKFLDLSKKRPFSVNDFETENNNWQYSSDKVKFDSLIGGSYLLYNGAEFACSYEMQIKEEDKDKVILAQVEVLSENLINPSLVFSVEKEGESLSWSANEFKLFDNPDTQNDLFIKSLNLKSIEIKDGAVLKIYIWNKNKEDFSIDNFSIKKY